MPVSMPFVDVNVANMRLWIHYAWLVLIAAKDVTGSSHGQISTAKWFNESRIKDFITDNSLISKIGGIGKIDCARRCSSLEECISFFYTIPSRTCRMHSQNFEVGVPDANLIHEPQTGFFVNKCNHADYRGLTQGTKIKKYIRVHFTHTASYTEAKQFCEDNNGTLIKIKTMEEIDLIMNGLAKMASQHIQVELVYRNYWVGAKRQTSGPGFNWNGGASVATNLWGTDEPEAGKDCVLLASPGVLGSIDCVYTDSAHELYPLCQCTV